MREEIIEQNFENYFHVYNRVNNKESFPVDMNELWKIYLGTLIYQSSRCSQTLYVATLMKNHFHFMVHAPLGNIRKFLHGFSLNFTRNINQNSNRINRIFGRPIQHKEIKDYESARHVFFYIYENSVDAKIVTKASNYPYVKIFQHIDS